MKFLILTGACLIAGVSIANYVGVSNELEGFTRFSPAEKEVTDQFTMTYPRNGMLLYRGTSNGRIDLQMALRAMYNQKDVYLRSTLFKKYEKTLRGKRYSKAVLNGRQQRRVQEVLRSYGKKKLTELEATREAKKLVDIHFETMNDSTIVNNFVNYKSGRWQDWPTSVLFSSIIPNVAAKYGGRVVVIKEEAPRSLDLGFWNFINHGIWYVHNRDAGEFTAPGYIPGTDIVGYEVRKSSASSWRIKGSKNPLGGGFRVQKDWQLLEYAFYKITYKGEIYVVVLNGQRRMATSTEATIFPSRNMTCVWKVSDFDYRECQQVSGKKVRRDQVPRLFANSAGVYGVVKKCQDKENCQVPRELLSKFRTRSHTSLTRKYVKKISKVQLADGSFLKFFGL